MPPPALALAVRGALGAAGTSSGTAVTARCTSAMDEEGLVNGPWLPASSDRRGRCAANAADLVGRPGLVERPGHQGGKGRVRELAAMGRRARTQAPWCASRPDSRASRTCSPRHGAHTKATQRCAGRCGSGSPRGQANGVSRVGEVRPPGPGVRGRLFAVHGVGPSERRQWSNRPPGRSASNRRPRLLGRSTILCCSAVRVTGTAHLLGSYCQAVAHRTVRSPPESAWDS